MTIRRCWQFNKGGRRPFGCPGLLLVFIVTLIILSGCAAMHPIAYQGAPQAGCDSAPQPVASGSFPLSEHLPLPIDALEHKLTHEPFTILAAKSTSGGSTSAMRLTLQFQDCSVVHVKWRAATASGQAYNNNPRKELVAYAIQKLFLDPQDYVVPVTTAACISKDVLRKIGAPFQVQRRE